MGWLQGQPVGARAYVEDLANERFINLYRLLPAKNKQPPRPALDLSILLEEVMGEIKPLNWDAVIQSPVPLKVRARVATELRVKFVPTSTPILQISRPRLLLGLGAASPILTGSVVIR